MSRPSRTAEALEILQSYYREHGILPAIEALTQLMGYRSPGSTYPVVKALIQTGHLEQEGKGARLKPGPLFGCVANQAEHIEALHALQSSGLRSIIATAPSKPEIGVLAGDTLLYSDVSPEPGDVLVVHGPKTITAHRYATAEPLPEGVLGVLQFQYRTY